MTWCCCQLHFCGESCKYVDDAEPVIKYPEDILRTFTSNHLQNPLNNFQSDWVAGAYPIYCQALNSLLQGHSITNIHQGTIQNLHLTYEVCLWTVGGNWTARTKTTHDRVEHANFTQKTQPGFKPEPSCRTAGTLHPSAARNLYVKTTTADNIYLISTTAKGILKLKKQISK